MARAPLKFEQGDVILFRAGQDYNLARVDLVRGAYLTCFPWSRSLSDWAKGRARINRSFAEIKLPGDCDASAISDRLNALANERDAKRASAKSAFENHVDQLMEVHAA